jgi:chromosomal replication initiator protein
MYLARTLTSASVKRIGRHFGGRSHTTVLHACDRVAEMLRTQADLRHRLRQIQAGLGRSNNTDD